MTIAAYLPDLHHFSGRGGKDVIPFYRDANASQPNVTTGLLGVLADAYGSPVTFEGFVEYVYALLGGQSYTKRFWNELETPGPRLPITRDGALFTKALALGRRLIWLHSYGERFQPAGGETGIPVGLQRR